MVALPVKPLQRSLFWMLFASSASSSTDFVFDWAVQANTSLYTYGHWAQRSAIAVDSADNSIITGHFYGTVDFNPGSGTFELTAAGTDVFVLKLNSAGGFLWAVQLGSQAQGIAVDSADNIIVAGTFVGTVDFNPGSGTFELTAAGTDAFVLKLNSAGGFLWAVHLGGVGRVHREIAVDSADNIIVTGSFSGTVVSILDLELSSSRLLEQTHLC